MADPLVTLLRSAACRPLLVGLRSRAERGKPFTGTLRLKGLTGSERKAISDLTGQTLRNEHATIDLSALNQLVRDTARFESLLHLVEAAAGAPIENKRAAREQASEHWRRLWQQAAHRAAGDERQQRWISDLQQTGWLKARSHRDHETAEQMLDVAFDLLGKLPADGIPLPVFAATHVGDAHALDLNRDLGRLVCRGIAARHAAPTPTKRGDLRRMWESVGIVPDELSVTVLTLNLPALGNSLTDQILRSHTQLAEPCRLTFRHLRLYPPTIERVCNSLLFVCENPSILVAAAERLGPRCRPMVCVEGQPNLAAWKLLSVATASGWQLAYHGDFDWGGIRIANQIHERFGFVPWKFDAAHYNQATKKGRELLPPAAQARWDADLTQVMETAGRVVEEEQIIEHLLVDLYA